VLLGTSAPFAFLSGSIFVFVQRTMNGSVNALQLSTSIVGVTKHRFSKLTKRIGLI